MQKRRLGRSGIEGGAIGLGTWALGGPFWDGENPRGWGEVDDLESIRTIQTAVGLGMTLIDTADVYGAGHAERVIGEAVQGRRDAVVLATKWGNTFDESSKQKTGENTSPGYVRQALTGSLARLNTDYLDVLQLHVGALPVEHALELAAACEELVDEGLLRTYGWSTDNAEAMDVFARRATRAAVVQHELNVLGDAPEMLAVCDEHDLASLNRSPLAMGLLTAKITRDTVIDAADVRGRTPEWLQWFKDGRPQPDWLARRDAVREILTSGGRTLAQGALAWILARHPRTIPIPGCRTVAQVEENAGAARATPLTAEDLIEIERLLTAQPV